MDSRNNEQKQTAASTVTSAVKTGKAIANIAKGAARGGMPGAALLNSLTAAALRSDPAMASTTRIPRARSSLPTLNRARWSTSGK